MIEYQIYFDLLVSYVKKMGYQIVETNCDSWDINTMTICNNKRRTIENRVIFLCHEIGHAVRYDKIKDNYFQIHPGFVSSSEKTQKVSEIEQEVLAWDEGLAIAKRLKIPVNQKKFAQIKTRCIQSYL